MLLSPRHFLNGSLLFSLLFASVLGFSAEVKTVDTSILKIEKPTSASGVYSLYSTVDGRIYTVTQDPSNRELIAAVERLAGDESRKPVHLILRAEGADDEVIGLTEMDAKDAGGYSDEMSTTSTTELLAQLNSESKVAPAPAPAALPAAIVEANQLGYEPTILNSMGEAQVLFDNEHNLAHDSQCHNRAMVWALDMYRFNGIKSMKITMFFTSKFQNTYLKVRTGIFGAMVKPYKWWYHTAPYVYVRDQEVVVDREFLSKPVTVDDWTYYFMSEFIDEWTTILKEQNPRHNAWGALTNAEGYQLTWTRGDGKTVPIYVADRLTREQSHCRVIKNYREINEPTSDDWCMVRKLPMYYHQPESIQRLDCDPSRDPAPRRPADRLRDGRLKFPCAREVLNFFDTKASEIARRDATVREPDPKTGR